MAPEDACPVHGRHKWQDCSLNLFSTMASLHPEESYVDAETVDAMVVVANLAVMAIVVDVALDGAMVDINRTNNIIRTTQLTVRTTLKHTIIT